MPWATAKKNYYGDIWKKSYMLEISNDGEPTIWYTFSLPPESVEYMFPQRVSETKTFGGVFIDDYGPEAIKISLSGTTGNSEVKKVYRKTNSELWLTGKQEMNHLRDEIVRYKQNSKTAGKDFGKAKLRLYNLSSISDDQLSANNLEVALDAWEVVLKDFKISQNKDKPFFFSYSIEFLGLHKLGKKRPIPSGTNPYSAEAIPSAATLSYFEKKLKDISDAYAWCEGVRSAVGDVQRSFNNFKREVAKYERMITGIVSWPTDLLGDVLYGATDIYKTVIGICEYPADLALSVIHGISALRGQIEAVVAMGNPLDNIAAAYGGVGQSFELELQNLENLCNGTYASGIKSSTPATVSKMNASDIATQEANTNAAFARAEADVKTDRADKAKIVAAVAAKALVSSLKLSAAAEAALVAAIGAAGEPEAIINVALAASEAAAAQARLEVATSAAASATAAASQSAARAKDASDAASVAVSVLSDSYNSDMAIVTYGTGPMVTVTSETTLEALALKYIGNADMSELIALYNRISGDADLVPGMYINIPILDERSQNKANMVFAKKNRRDSLGVDIRLDASGRMIVADYGDAETVSDANNMNQALLLRLTESLGNRTRLNMYGIKAAVGSPGTAVSGYLATSILDTAMQDPRIKKIDNLAMNGNEDNLALSFDYTCDDGKTYHFSGAV